MLREIDNTLIAALGLPYLRLTREQAIFDRCEYLLRVIQGIETRQLRILDVGCGSGAVLYFLSSKVPQRVAHYTGIDLDTSHLQGRYASVPVPHSFQDVDLDTDWNVGFFDLAWCAECLEHILDDRGVFRKICRAVRSGGLIVVTMPSRAHRERIGAHLPKFLEVSTIQDGGHVRLGYDRTSLADLCAGTTAELVRCDAVVRADLSYIYRRHCWPSSTLLLNNLLNIASRPAAYSYALGDQPIINYAEYESIGGVYRVK
jgi:SAM-dependent methyltransferase